MQTFKLRDGYDRTKNPPVATYRYMTPEEAKQLYVGQRVDFLALDGTVKQLTINGRVKTWKRDTERIEIPLKYGLYEYSYARNHVDSTGAKVVEPLLVKVV